MQTMQTAQLNVQVAPATLMAHEVTLIWDKPKLTTTFKEYRVYQDEVLLETIQRRAQTYITIRSLTAATKYQFTVQCLSAGEEPLTAHVTVVTHPAGKVLDVTREPFNADPTGHQLSTKAVQMAIDQARPGDTVLIPKQTVVLSGALELKSQLVFRVDGRLQGSLNPVDYTILPENRAAYPGSVNEDGLILTRYEGWEMYCYRSLVNAGYLDQTNRRTVTCHDICICGHGTIYGGGNALGTAMKALYADKARYPLYVSDGMGGRRIRGRLLGFIQCQNVHLTEFTVENPPCWTIHMIYCDTVTTHGIAIKSRGIDNGDGWDPDSSRHLLIFNTTFDTGDDCIAIKSGKNPDGNRVNMPTEDVRIIDLNMLGGHGMAIGSEESGGVSDVYLRDCRIQNTMYGLELKATNARGGYIRNVTMKDCTIDKFMAHSVGYNADGEAAKVLPLISDLKLVNTKINGQGTLVELVGFRDAADPESTEYDVQRVQMTNIQLLPRDHRQPEIKLAACHDIRFNQLTSALPIQYHIDKKTTRKIKVDDSKS